MGWVEFSTRVSIGTTLPAAYLPSNPGQYLACAPLYLRARPTFNIPFPKPNALSPAMQYPLVNGDTTEFDRGVEAWTALMILIGVRNTTKERVAECLRPRVGSYHRPDSQASLLDNYDEIRDALCNAPASAEASHQTGGKEVVGLRWSGLCGMLRQPGG